VTATVRVRNTGDRRGKQVVQVYASRPDSSFERPARWLAGFAVVMADPGETVEVPVDVHARTLRHWEAGRGWAVEPGDVVLSVGRSAGDLGASATVVLGAA
jgi:beta-glucosidase